MKLRQLLEELKIIDHTDEDCMEKEVFFNTANREGLTLLSVYFSNDTVQIDIGEDEEE